MSNHIEIRQLYCTFSARRTHWRGRSVGTNASLHVVKDKILCADRKSTSNYLPFIKYLSQYWDIRSKRSLYAAVKIFTTRVNLKGRLQDSRRPDVTMCFTLVEKDKQCWHTFLCGPHVYRLSLDYKINVQSTYSMVTVNCLVKSFSAFIEIEDVRPQT